MSTTCTVGIGDCRQLALGKQHYRYRHIDYIERLGRLNKSCIGIGIGCTKDYRYRHVIHTLSRLIEDYTMQHAQHALSYI